MTLDEALELGSGPLSGHVAFILAAEVRRLQAELATLKRPAQCAGKMDSPVQIADTNFAYLMNETDEEFKACGNAHMEVAG